jgi:hypothetical protein
MGNEAVAEQHSQGRHTPGAYGSSAPPSSERGMAHPHRIAAAAAIKRLGIARAILHTLSVASSYDRNIDSSSAGVAEIAGRLIDEALAELDPSRSTKEPSPTGAPP